MNSFEKLKTKLAELFQLDQTDLDFGIYLMQNKRLTIQDYEALCPEVNRRTLQRELKAMIDMELLVSEGLTNQLTYRMKG